ncbi:hypothetical protein [Rhizobium sp. NRK18]|uniref:hypothetical protein n=1 Tax=Rhizobium sp. NRK18 TaxID=2964667 RepID=UPI0021C3B9CB|nr:hypothetical protein [Rhizobium sp. NRK18]MCQ2005030.1 hypothetical protein [Rhizobium sp. NRK18]
MLEDDVASFIAGNVMMIAATRDGALRAHVGRGCGAYFDADTGELVLLVSSSQWPDFFANARKGGPIAMTVCQPDNYRALQIKGTIAGVDVATEVQSAKASDYRDRMLAIMDRLGVSRLQLSTVFSNVDLAAIRFWPVDLFIQTPGPEAGERVQRSQS